MRRVIVAVALLAMALSAWAHTTSVAYLGIEVPADNGPLRLELDLSIRDLALTLPLDADRDERVTWGELSAMRSRIHALATSNVALAAGSRACELEPTGLGTRQYGDGAYATLLLQARCPAAANLTVTYQALMNRDPQHRAVVTIRRGKQVSTGLVHEGDRQFTVGLEGKRLARRNPFMDFLREGIHHILIGYDHLAFLISLVLPAALVRDSGRWRPAKGFRHPLLHVLGIATAFTIAHSITLSMAALGWVTPASRWVEAAIALSVLLVALNNVWPVVVRRAWVVGFVFGLVHGFGFAGVLSELGIPPGEEFWALLGFNLGVEIGQAAVVAVLLAPVFLLSKKSWYARWIMPAVSIGIAALAGHWLWQRLGG